MRQTVVLLFMVCLSLCFGKTSQDLPSDEETIENFQKHRQKLKQIRGLVLSNLKYELSERLDDLLEESNCTSVSKRREGSGEHYFTISKFDNSIEAISKLQLNGKMTDAVWRAEFEIDQIKSSISFPYAKWGEARNVEVMTRSNPQFGEGGAIQFITKGPIKLLRLVNIKTGEIITF